MSEQVKAALCLVCGRLQQCEAEGLEDDLLGNGMIFGVPDAKKCFTV